MEQLPSPSPLLVQGQASEASAAPIAKKNRPASHRIAEQMERAVRTASKSSPCPSISWPLYAYSRSSQRAYAMACGSWACPTCARKKKAIARRAIEDGMWQAFARGERVRFITVTDDGKGEMRVPDLYASWSRLRIILKRGGYLSEYAAALEVQRRGALHLHVLATGSYVPVRELSRLAVRAGFGPVVDVRAVKGDALEDAKNSAAYVAKELAGYVMKDGKSLADKTAVRRRPVRFSHKWGSSLGDAKKDLAREMAEARDSEVDPGPWVVVRVTSDGSLVTRAGQGLPRVVPPPIEDEERAAPKAQASDADEVRAAA